VSRKTLTLFTFGALVLALAGGVAWRIAGDSGAAGGGRPPARPLTVDTAPAQVKPMPILVTAVGQVVSEHTVAVRPQVSGMLQAVHFTEGDMVKAGEPLFDLDAAPFQAAAEAARAAWENAKAQAERLEPLAGKDFVTPQEYDNARAAADQAKAALTQAEINLAYTRIRSPITGRTGSLGVKPGNLVGPSDAAPLVTVNQMQPILVQYSVPQQMLPEVRRRQADGTVRVFVTREDGTGDLGQGALVFIDNQVRTDTGTVTLKARVPNTGEALWPGQYVGVRTRLAMEPKAVVVPQGAVQTGQDGNFVYLVEQGRVAVRPVQVDRQVEDLAVIASGLTGGETVVVRVPRNLRPGLDVVVAEAPASGGGKGAAAEAGAAAGGAAPAGS
jgi:RND family efflux transporter MFP subunit